MWLFSKYGVISVVQIPKRIDVPGSAGGRRSLQIRSRERSTLESIREELCLPNRLDCSHVVNTPVRDYPYRMYVDPLSLVAIVGRLALGVDYENFKGAMQDAGSDKATMNMLHDVWSSVYHASLPEQSERSWSDLVDLVDDGDEDLELGPEWEDFDDGEDEGESEQVAL
jgi:hypothetical protein